MYRFLATPRWLGYAAVTVLLAAVMVELGGWQLHRYHARGDFNARIDAGTRTEPVPLDRVLAAPPDRPGAVGPAPDADALWTRVTITGRYDRDHEILVRGRAVDGTVGFEIVTPLLLADGTGVLIDRGWLAPPAEGGANAAPVVPGVPDGPVTVVGRVHAPASRAGRVDRVDGRLEARRIVPRAAARQVRYPLYGAYLDVQSQSPPADHRFVAIPPVRQNTLVNIGYAAQWWMFAGLTLFGFGYLAHRQAHPRPADEPLWDPDEPSPFPTNGPIVDG